MQKQMPVQEFLLGNGQSDIRRHCHVLLPDVYLILVSTYSFQLLTTYKSLLCLSRNSIQSTLVSVGGVVTLG